MCAPNGAPKSDPIHEPPFPVPRDTARLIHATGNGLNGAMDLIKAVHGQPENGISIMRIFSAILGATLLALFVPFAPAKAWAQPALRLSEAAAPTPQAAQRQIPMPALVFDLDTGEVLLAHDAGQRWYPASLTKLMTAYLVMDAVDRGLLSFTAQATISKKAIYSIERGASVYGARPGDVMRIGDMLSFLMVRSDADMANALAEAVAGGMQAFVERMNEAAARLGMTGSSFANPHGMHSPEQFTTARDMGVLARAIYTRFLKKHPDWWRFFATRRVRKTVVRKNKARTYTLKNRNYLLFMMPEADGMKTGFLCTSGFNLIATARRNGTRLAAVVFGRRSAYNRASVARVLLEEGFRRKGSGKTSRVRLAQLRNGLAPAVNMRPHVCNKRVIPEVTDRLNTLSGWAVLLGPFKTSLRALGVVEAELLAAELADAGKPYGTLVIPVKEAAQVGAPRIWQVGLDAKGHARKPRRRYGYGALIWQLDEPQALDICKRAAAHRVGCAVQAPMELARLREELRNLAAKRRAARKRTRARRKEWRRKAVHNRRKAPRRRYHVVMQAGKGTPAKQKTTRR